MSAVHAGAAAVHAVSASCWEHLQVMREGIAAHGGYEINTEGDAFHIAFVTVAQAVSFAMEAQVRPTRRALLGKTVADVL